MSKIPAAVRGRARVARALTFHGTKISARQGHCSSIVPIRLNFRLLRYLLQYLTPILFLSGVSSV
jgi:hypothetical protein